jgi:hypothetical protein
LAAIRDACAASYWDPSTEERLGSMLDQWRRAPRTALPYTGMRELLEEIRRIPASDERVGKMNTLVRTLGRPHNLATYLDVLRDAGSRDGSDEQAACKSKLQSGRMHSVYGWCGNTLLGETSDAAVSGTSEPVPGLEARLGFSTSVWNLTLHVWQPNANARGFPVESLDEDVLVEPPHSHPFEFSSCIVMGEMRQSLYFQSSGRSDEGRPAPSGVPGTYDGIPLEHVDGVWPPHLHRTTCDVRTLEHRVKLSAGDSYYMPCDWIHDVEVDREAASARPAVSLFLSSESIVMPHVYMLPSMVELQEQNPDLKRSGSAISEGAWHAKLEALAAYLRGEADLDLDSIVRHRGRYAFFHCRSKHV